MPESERPLLRGNSISTASPGSYMDLLVFEVDPTKELFIDSIAINVSDATTIPLINVSLNGTPFLKDFPMINTSEKFGFGRHWKVVKRKIAVHIEIKGTAAGVAGTLRASAWVSGVEL